jgi:Family of unknown function (DUF6307)
MVGNVGTAWGYEHRVRLVTDALIQHSEMSPESAGELAKHVLYAIDHIPERVR